MYSVYTLYICSLRGAHTLCMYIVFITCVVFMLYTKTFIMCSLSFLWRYVYALYADVTIMFKI